jgi:hypothetical protein
LNAKKSITQEVWNAHFIIEDSCIKGDLLFTNSPLHCIYILKTAITSQFYIKMLWLVFCILLILYGELWQSYVFCLYCMVSCVSIFLCGLSQLHKKIYMFIQRKKVMDELNKIILYCYKIFICNVESKWNLKAKTMLRKKKHIVGFFISTFCKHLLPVNILYWYCGKIKLIFWEKENYEMYMI